jgi:hypothetical protein
MTTNVPKVPKVFNSSRDIANPSTDEVRCVSRSCSDAAIRPCGVALTLRCFGFLKREGNRSLRCECRALGDQSCEFVGREAVAQECGEAVVRRRLGELAQESMSLQRGVGIAFECGRAHKIAAQRDDEREMFDCLRDAVMVRFARGIDPDYLARRCERAGKIVHPGEIAREVQEQVAEQARISTEPRRGKYLAQDRNPGVLAGVPGANGGGRYNALTCGTLAAVPDTYTGIFDTIGGFTQPNLIAMNLQLSYDVSPRLALTGTIANLFNTCWGGAQEPWTYGDHNFCGYDVGGYEGEILPIGNIYNPPGFHGSIIQPFIKYPYNPLLGPFNQAENSTKMPLNFYVTAQIKI